MNKQVFSMMCGLALLASAGLGALTGCESNIRPLRPVQRVEVWAPDEPASASDAGEGAGASGAAPTTMPADAAAATAPAAPDVAATEPAATQPGRMVMRVIDPNQTARFIYKASYDNIWQQAMEILSDAGFALDRQDYRLGTMTTRPLQSAQIIEFWKRDHTEAKNALENTMHNQRRIVRLSISKVPGKPDFYEIGVQVLVERRSNPTEQIGGPIFVEGSGFGRNAITLRSDYADPATPAGRWVPIGHDPDLERRLITELFNRI